MLDGQQIGGAGAVTAAGLSHPAVHASLRDYDTAIQRLDEVLARQPYLLGDSFSAADLLCAGPFAWFGDQMPAMTSFGLGRPAKKVIVVPGRLVNVVL